MIQWPRKKERSGKRVPKSGLESMIIFWTRVRAEQVRVVT